jgi:hypothetical protein
MGLQLVTPPPLIPMSVGDRCCALSLAPHTIDGIVKIRLFGEFHKILAYLMVELRHSACGPGGFPRLLRVLCCGGLQLILVAQPIRNSTSFIAI